MPYRNQQPPVTPSNAKALTTWIYLIAGFIFLFTIPRIYWESSNQFFKLWWQNSTSSFLVTLFVLYAAKWSGDVVSAISRAIWQDNPLATQETSSPEEDIQREANQKDVNNANKEEVEVNDENVHRPSFFVFHVVFSLAVFYITSHWILMGGYIFVGLFMFTGVVYSMGSSILHDLGWRKLVNQ